MRFSANVFCTEREISGSVLEMCEVKQGSWDIDEK